ncbi:sensor histidine kinase [Streptomyces phyllanthi]|uniref:histidine kinase n=1 Tax=Streptomyces phyllanthi TaxID=1803180 RepID=A0A5N8W8T5_9ACTN|nr:histidine kinase [Streptomyces phyllanthi]MPY43891.1 sensor histidine kinase [Streptomyces phyllanthi]
MNLALDTKAPAGGGTDRPGQARQSGCLRTGAVVLLFLACGTDVLIHGAEGAPIWPLLLVLAVGLTALLWPARRRPAWLTPQVRTSVPPLTSLAYVLALVALREEAPPAPGQVTLLLCLMFVAVRSCPPRAALVCGALGGIAVLALPLPYYVVEPDSSLAGVLAVFLLVVGLTVGLAAYVRTLDNRRRAAVTEIRRAERLAMAADLHDFVAHHVTGILVQAQVARMMASTEPGKLDPVLAGIERAATEALASMRRTVGVLREHHETAEPEDRRPVGDLTALTELVDGFDGVGGADGHRAELHRDPSVPDDLPHEVQAAAFRVVQEALTNVRRHAADATEVTVALRYAAGALEISVRDDGRGGARLPEAARGGGFGLVGLTERVTALQGRIEARPREEGPGWEVLAVLPAAPGRDAPVGRG